MRFSIIPLAIIVCIIASDAGLCQAPPNDNFTDSIVLSGNDITFAGTLIGATTEPGEPVGRPISMLNGFHPERSVWWSWTATDTTPVTLIALSYSADEGQRAAICVYPGTNIFGVPQPTPAAAGIWLDASINKVSISFQATAGVTYQIQFADYASFIPTNLTMSFRLVATNPPVILEPPTPQVVSPGGSALFTVVAAGIPPISYQWLSNGFPILGETRPILALDNITTDQAGDYSVILSNATGTITSPAASLAVSSNVVSPLLNVASTSTTNGFGFTLDGETGRYYRIESSTDLVSWLPEVSFPFYQPVGFGNNPSSSVIYNTNSPIFLVVPQNTPGKFFRTSAYAAPNEICNNNLKQIQFAKELWHRNVFVTRNSLPTVVDLVPYLGSNFSFYTSCPSGGYYYINDVRTPPTCTVPGHVLEESR
jgi:hypothetical protein